ncbi:MAG TPA: hemolysin family protein [Micromonosporaceae bacterium]
MDGGSTRPGAGASPDSGRDDQTLVQSQFSARWRRSLARILVRWADAATRWVTRLLGESPNAGRAHLSEAELRDLVAHSEALDGDERRLIDDVIGAGDRHVRELMVPRTDVVFLDADASLAQAAELVRASRHSRFPVVNGSHDDVLGFVHLRDLLVRPEADRATTVRELTRPLRQLPASKRVLPALSEMRRAGDHLALVVDEYGGTAGIVSLEDLIEELVGDIHDEYDVAPEPDDGAAVSEVDGRLNLNDLSQRIGLVLPPGPYDTVAGYVMATLGRVPTVGDEVVVPAHDQQWRLHVVAMEGRRVARIGVSRPVVEVVAPRAEPVPMVAPAGELAH